jgi:hypothetical protein
VPGPTRVSSSFSSALSIVASPLSIGEFLKGPATRVVAAVRAIA